MPATQSSNPNLDLWPHFIDIVMDCHCAKFSDFSFSDRSTHTTTVGMCKDDWQHNFCPNWNILFYCKNVFRFQYLSWHCDSDNDLMKVELVTRKIIFVNDIERRFNVVRRLVHVIYVISEWVTWSSQLLLQLNQERLHSSTSRSHTVLLLDKLTLLTATVQIYYKGQRSTYVTNM